ncbi:MAG: hypothetical protein ACYC1D_13625, partial [Acidimicrobiales bacterium]
QAWEPPQASDISLSASGAPSGGTITATLQVSTGGATPAQAYGSTGGVFVFAVGGRTFGPTTQTSVTISGLTAGIQYTPTVMVSPAGHPTATVTVTGSPFTQTLPWPTGLAVAVTPSVSPDFSSGTVTASFPNLPAGSFAGNGTITCGSSAVAFNGGLVGGRLSATVDLNSFGGNCALSVSLIDAASPNPYGVASPILHTTFVIGTLPSYSFNAQLDPSCQNSVCLLDRIYDVNYGAAPPNAGQPMLGGANWTVTLSDGNSSCFQSAGPSAGPPTFPVKFTLSVLCPPPTGETVSWEYLGQTTTVTLGSPSGAPATTTTTTTPPVTTLPSTTTTVPVPTSTTRSPSTKLKAGVVRPEAGPAVLAASLQPQGPLEGSQPAQPIVEAALVVIGMAGFGGILAGRRQNRSRRRRP